MKATIILTHPWHGSFNKAIIDTVVEAYKRQNKNFQVIYLNRDDFNLVLKEGDLALYVKGKYNDPLVGKYQRMLNK